MGSIVFPSLHAALAEAFPAAVLLFLQPLFQSVHRLPALRRSTLRELLHAGEGGQAGLHEQGFARAGDLPRANARAAHARSRSHARARSQCCTPLGSRKGAVQQGLPGHRHRHRPLHFLLLLPPPTPVRVQQPPADVFHRNVQQLAHLGMVLGVLHCGLLYVPVSSLGHTLCGAGSTLLWIVSAPCILQNRTRVVRKTVRPPTPTFGMLCRPHTFGIA